MFINNGSRRKEDLFKEEKHLSEGDQDCQKNIKSICINESVLSNKKATKNIAGIVTEVSQKA
jgi:hypothetical protein